MKNSDIGIKELALAAWVGTGLVLGLIVLSVANGCEMQKISNNLILNFKPNIEKQYVAKASTKLILVEEKNNCLEKIKSEVRKASAMYCNAYDKTNTGLRLNNQITNTHQLLNLDYKVSQFIKKDFNNIYHVKA